MREYPEELDDEMGFDEIVVHDVGSEYYGRETSGSVTLSREVADEVTDLMLVLCMVHCVHWSGSRRSPVMHSAMMCT